MDTNQHSIKRALISVSDKTGLVAFAQGLVAQNIEILSTGGTAALLREHNIAVGDVSDYTEFPELMAGRLKTLHPKIHGGILSRRAIDEAALKAHKISEIDLVVVNLYPFEKTVANANTTLAEAIENIDIGGPTMLRAAAKNYQYVTVVVDADDYELILISIKQYGGIDDKQRYQLAVKAFAHTAHYDGAIANYLGSRDNEFPVFLHFSALRKQTLRYGENPHQKAAFYQQVNNNENGIGNAEQLQGKALSFNNIVDADSALECVRALKPSACVIVKHANPCGVAQKETAVAAYKAAYLTDPTSAFGGVMAFNTNVDGATARAITKRQFVEVLIAPEFDEEAKNILANKADIRVLTCAALTPAQNSTEIKQVTGALLVQTRDVYPLDKTAVKVVTNNTPDEAQMNDLLFAWVVAQYVKSNAIVYAKNEQTIGIGAGQMSRVYSAKVATMKAAAENLDINGAVMASDAFFPFRDSIDTAAAAGIKAIIQPGGSKRDDEVIAACNEAGIAMVFTAVRHFRH